MRSHSGKTLSIKHTTMKYALYGLIILALGLVGFLFLGNKGTDAPTQSFDVPTATQDSEVLKLSAVITNRSYSPKQIDVPFGATVELTVKNNDNEQHGLFLQNFGVQDFVGPLRTKTIRFIANTRGESATFCSVAHPEKLVINVI